MAYFPIPRFALIILLAWVTVTNGEQPREAARIRQVAVLAISLSEDSEEAAAFRTGLHEAGYVEGRDISISWWSGRGSYDQVADAAAGLVKRKVDVIVVEGAPAAIAAKRATVSIPIVMALVGDPVGIGVIQSLGHPGGNVTGLTNQTVDLNTKRLQLLKEAIPKAVRLGVLFNPDTPYSRTAVAKVKSGAKAVGLTLKLESVRNVEQIHAAMAALRRWRADVIMPLDDAFMTPHVPAILEEAWKARVPVVYAHRPLVRRGVLLSYAVQHQEMFRHAASYVDKILKGAAPSSLPVEQPTRFELAINLKTADVLGLTISQSVLLQAEDIVR